MAIASLVYFKKMMEMLQTTPELRRTVVGVGRQVAYAAAGTAVGGLAFGPVGALGGGIVGAAVGYGRADDYDALLVVLQRLSDAEKRALQQKVQQLVGSAAVEDLVAWLQAEAHRSLLMQTLKAAAAQAA